MQAWKCKECGGGPLFVSQSWIAEHGSPICGECDEDMTLVPRSLDSHRFDREQLVFMVGCALSSALNRMDSALPPAITLAEHESRKRRELDVYFLGCMETASMNLAYIYAQTQGKLVGDSMDACGGVLCLGGFEEFYNDFRAARLAGGHETPSCRPLAEKYVDELFSGYLAEALE